MYIIFSYLYFNCFFRSCIFFSSNLIILFRVYCCVGCLFHLFFYFVFLASFSRFLIIVFLQLLASLIGWLFMFHFSFFFFIFCLNDNSCDSFLVFFLFFRCIFLWYLFVWMIYWLIVFISTVFFFVSVVVPVIVFSFVVYFYDEILDRS